MSLVRFSDNFAQISLNIKNMNYSSSILANLNNTMQTKQHAMKKPNSNSNRNKIYKGILFVEEGCSKSSKLELYSVYLISLFLEVLFFYAL